MYHSHFNELQQIGSGLYGPIVVLEPDTPSDPELDRVFLVSDAGPTTNLIRGPFPGALVNGRAKPEPIELDAGVTYRFRLINIRTDYTTLVSLRADEELEEWRFVAKDGADLPAVQAITGPATLSFTPGEIHDVEFTPRTPGELTLEFAMPPQGRAAGQVTTVPIRVRPR